MAGKKKGYTWPQLVDQIYEIDPELVWIKTWVSWV